MRKNPRFRASVVRQARVDRGLSQALAARHPGIDAGTLVDVEAGLTLPPDPVKMARVYGVSAEALAVVARRTGG